MTARATTHAAREPSPATACSCSRAGGNASQAGLIRPSDPNLIRYAKELYRPCYYDESALKLSTFSSHQWHEGLNQ